MESVAEVIAPVEVIVIAAPEMVAAISPMICAIRRRLPFARRTRPRNLRSANRPVRQVARRCLLHRVALPRECQRPGTMLRRRQPPHTRARRKANRHVPRLGGFDALWRRKLVLCAARGLHAAAGMLDTGESTQASRHLAPSRPAGFTTTASLAAIRTNLRRFAARPLAGIGNNARWRAHARWFRVRPRARKYLNATVRLGVRPSAHGVNRAFVARSAHPAERAFTANRSAASERMPAAGVPADSPAVAACKSGHMPAALRQRRLRQEN